MNWLVYHIVSGASFFTGIVLLVVAAGVSGRSGGMFRQVGALAFVIGVIAVLVSSTAIPYWYYGVAAAVTAGWMVSLFRKRWVSVGRWGMIGVWVGAGLLEMPYHLMPKMRGAGDRKVTIIGDSVTAGMGGDEKSETWPKIFAREHGLEVQDISHVGETAASALKRARTKEIRSSVVIVEIGGNDVLGSTRSREFERDLDGLLGHLRAEGRQVVMFELPLPPFFHEFGRIQREMAAKHGVLLVPKRVFLSVIAGSAETLDSIHLSQSGHQRMSERVWGVVRGAYDQKTTARSRGR